MLDPIVQKNFSGYSYEPKGMGQPIVPMPIKKGAPQSAKLQRRTKSLNLSMNEQAGKPEDMIAPVRPISNLGQQADNKEIVDPNDITI